MLNTPFTIVLLFITLFIQGCKQEGANDVPLSSVRQIACIGTSITFGHGLNPNETYPHNLQLLVGSSPRVMNYGVSGSTLLRRGDKPYWMQAEYAESLRWNPNIVIIELGTNDSKLQNWQYKDEFVNDYVALIHSYQELASLPQVYVCVPPPAAANRFDIRPSVVNDSIRSMVNSVATLTHTRVIDLYSSMRNRESLFQDGIHPTAAGAVVLSDEVYRVLNTR